MSEEKKIGPFRKFLNLLFNVVWVIFVGLGGAIGCIFTGIATICTIIPIFFGVPKVWFNAVPLVFSPAGKKVVLHYGEAPVRNTINLIFGGLINYLGYLFVGLVFCVTIIGIPLGLQVFKFAKYFLAPFKAEVVKL